MSQTMFASMADQVAGTPWAFTLAGTATSILPVPPGQSAATFQAFALAELLAVQAARVARGSGAAFVAKETAVATIAEMWTSVGGVEPADSRSAAQLNSLIPAAV
jgi:hypothetical protein